MVKRTITTWWIVGAVVMIVGVILALASSLALVAHIGDVTTNFRYSFVPDSYFWTLISLIVLGGIALVGGIAVQFVAWIGAVINTNRLVDKTWFNVLLWGGIVGIVLGPLFGLGALFWWGLMIAYLIAGPDGMAVQPPLFATPVAPPKTLAPTG
jgi:hypothetical protein